LAAFGRIAQVLDSRTGQAEVLHEILGVVEAAGGFRHATIMLVTADGSELVVGALRGGDRRSRTDVRYRRGEGVTGAVLQSGQAIAIPDVQVDPRFCDRVHRRSERGESGVGFVCVPVTADGEIVGTLAVDVPAPGPDDLERALSLLVVVATMIGRDVQLRREADQIHRALREENLSLRRALGEHLRVEGIVGESAAMREIYGLIPQVAAGEMPVFLHGGIGTGKELIARAIHCGSRRSAGPFVRIGCATRDEDLLAAELFGHERGPDPGARFSRRGRIEDAAGGTVYLDDLGGCTLSLQARLLRLLQEETYQRNGSPVSRRADIRLIVGSTVSLEELLAQRRLDPHLYYRLNILPLRLPALIERRMDIPLLADHFARQHGHRLGRTYRRISSPAIALLLDHAWPGNVRELEGCMAHAVMVSRDGTLRATDLPPTLRPDAHPAVPSPAGPLPSVVAELERARCREALAHTNGNVAAAARELGVTARILRYKLRKLGLAGAGRRRR
jgi:Nif-specific regulatory protein